MKAVSKGIFLLFLIFSLSGCSRKKNNFLSRNWHAITTEYNTLYNGNLAFELGKEELNANYQDNYWSILPVERMQVSEEIMLPGTSKNPNFAIAEEKAVKAIQRHSMLIDGRERNPQIDEAYLLLGKARYFDQRFVPALEAFNYILYKYPVSNTINEARIWREKTNMRLGFDELALENLKEVLALENLKEENRADASAMLAQAYINLQHLDSAVVPIKRAAVLTENEDEKGRYWFIAGQLYTNLGKIDSANLAFDEVIELKRKIPRIYRVNAFLAKIRNKETLPEQRAAVLALLHDLEEDRENRPFLDRIYFQLARFHQDMDSTDLAIEYFHKSLGNSAADNYLQAMTYRTLGDINFEAARYRLAGAYYDSTLIELPQNTREFRLIKQKRENLEEVIFFENVARKTDSILFLSELSKAEQLEFFTSYTEKLKVSAKEEMEATGGISAEGAFPFAENQGAVMAGIPNTGSSFYFYNPARVASGEIAFFEIWGDRPLTDNWRTGGMAASLEDSEEEILSEEIFINNPAFDPQTYISQIPDDPELLDSLAEKRNNAFYQLGLIYHEKFGENILAAEKLELLLKSDPGEKLILPAKYYLFKIYTQMGAKARAQAMKNDIIYSYPDSRYAAIIKNPQSLKNSENNPENLYKEIYELYQDQEFEEVISRSEILISGLTGDAIVPKLELLKAMAVGRILGFEEYKDALNFVMLTYPQTEEGKKALQLYTEALPELENPEFKDDTSAESFKLIFPFSDSDTIASQSAKKELLSLLKEPVNSHLELSFDVYDPQKNFFVIHGFRSEIAASNFMNMLIEEEKITFSEEPFIISAPNYAVLQIHKNLDAYLSQ